jgi:rhamnose utilization protein RhaD (predicted bifunctional aldolase and dehydrogenase)
MSDKYEILQQLITMSRNLGMPEKDYVIMGEGNTSARVDEATYWIKASGSQLHQIQAESFVQVEMDQVLSILDEPALSDADMAQRLAAAQVDPTVQARPSIEAAFHALALSICGAKFVGHTHPTPLNMILCSQHVLQAIRGRLFPEEVTYCGPAPAFVPYGDPGIALACKMRDILRRHLDDYGEPAKVVYIQNHGLVALGQTPHEVEYITAMCVKVARVLWGTYALGGPHFMSAQDVRRIHTRPDEAYRRAKACRA